MRVPVRVSGQNTVGSRFDEETQTLNVNANGALILLSTSVRRGQSLKLLNIVTRDMAECVVAYLGRRQGDRLEVGIDFILPTPNFWRCFPPLAE
jgi:hypothetical protein